MLSFHSSVFRLLQSYTSVLGALVNVYYCVLIFVLVLLRTSWYDFTPASELLPSYTSRLVHW